MSNLVEVKIPTNANPFTVTVNGKKYSYPAGATVQVPPEVAEVIEQISRGPNLPPSSGGGSGGGGADLLNADGVIKQEHLPEGYPYVIEKVIVDETTVTVAPNEQLNGFIAAVLYASWLPEEIPSFIYVNFNDTIYPCASNMQGFGNASLYAPQFENTGEPFLLVFMGEEFILITAEETTATVSVYIQDVTPLDNEYLNNDVAKYGINGEVIRIEWDGVPTVDDSFRCNAFSYYKVSDIAVPYEHIVNFKYKLSNQDEVENGNKGLGTNCYKLSEALIITKAGTGTDPDGAGFNAPSTGVYFIKHNFTTGLAWGELLEIDTRRENSILYLTNPSGVKYAITVDDNGNLSATEA